LIETQFSWLYPDEVVLSFHRRHPYFLALRLLLPAFLLTLPAAFWLLGSSGPFLSLGYLFLGPLAALLFMWFYLDWQNDYYVVTNKRVVHVEKVILFYEERNEALLGRIQNVTLVSPHPLARLLGFANLVIETAGTRGKMVLSGLPQADRVQEEILAQLARSREGEPPLEEALVKPQDMVVAKRGTLPLLLDYLFPRLRLEEGSQVTWRKHWYVLLRRMAGPLILLILFLEVGVAVAWGLPLVSFLPRTSALVLCVTAASLSALFLLYRYEDWRNDIYVLTDDRIIEMEKKPLFLREERREASLAMIQDVRYLIPGPVYNLLNVGMVIIETAATEGEFTFDWVHDPRRVQGEIFARLDAYREREKRREQEAQAAQMQKWLEVYRKAEKEPPEEPLAQAPKEP
jgi:membrane protein YdbS with pleckstrin-like domain